LRSGHSCVRTCTLCAYITHVNCARTISIFNVLDISFAYCISILFSDTVPNTCWTKRIVFVGTLNARRRYCKRSTQLRVDRVIFTHFSRALFTVSRESLLKKSCASSNSFSTVFHSSSNKYRILTDRVNYRDVEQSIISDELPRYHGQSWALVE